MAKFCAKCGSELKEGSKFCVKCGAPVQGTPVQGMPGQGAPMQGMPGQNAQPGGIPGGYQPGAGSGMTAAKNAFPWKLLALIAVPVVLIILILVLIIRFACKVNPLFAWNNGFAMRWQLVAASGREWRNLPNP